MWPVRDRWVAREGLTAQERLAGMMTEMEKAVKERVASETHRHRVEKSEVIKKIAACDDALGLGIPGAGGGDGAGGGGGAGANGRSEGSVEGWAERRAAAEAGLLRLLEAEQRRWHADRGYDESLREDTCWRGFFEEARAGRVYSYVERLHGLTGVCRGMPAIFREVSRHFGAVGSIFNIQRLTRATHAGRRAAETDTERLVRALREDGKTV